MPALLERPGFTLWVSELLPSDSAQWKLLDSGPSRHDLERQAKSLAPYMANRRLSVVEGQSPPHWRPKL